MMRAMMGRKRVEVVEKITESGSWIVPKGCHSVEVWVVGGGGGGGSCGHAGGGGGGGGQIVHQILKVIPGTIIPATIGLGGTLGYQMSSYVHSNSTDGEPSSFGDIIALGGKAGQQAGGSYSFVVDMEVHYTQKEVTVSSVADMETPHQPQAKKA